MLKETNEERQALLTDAFVIGVELAAEIQGGALFEAVLSELDGPFVRLDDGCLDCHPAPYAFDGILRLFLYRETTGWSYRRTTRHYHLADVFGLDEIPTESAMSRAWQSRLDDAAQTFITTAAHYLVRKIHRDDMDVPNVRPQAEVEQGVPTIEDEQTTRATTTGVFTSFRVTWGWLGVGRLKGQRAFSIDGAESTAHTGIPISEL